MTGNIDSDFATWLLETVSQIYACAPEPNVIAECVEKCTTQKVHVAFDSQGILVGIDIEDADTRYSERIDLTNINCNEEGSWLLQHRFLKSIRNCDRIGETTRNL